MNARWTDRLDWAALERVAWRSGLCLTAVLLPLDRLPVSVARPLLWLSLGLLLVRPLAGLRQPALMWRTIGRRRALVVGATLGAVGLAAWASVPGAADQAVAMGAAVTLSWLLMRALIVALWSDRADVTFLAKSLVAMGLVVVGLGWLQAAGDLIGLPSSITGLLPRYSHTATYVVPRPQSTALEPLYLAHFLLIPLGVLLAARLARRRAWLMAAILAVTSLVVATGSRGGLLGLATVLGLAGWLWLVRRPGGRRLAIGLGALSGVAMVALGVWAWAGYRDAPVTKDVKVERTWQAALGHYFDFNDRSANTRYELWPRAIELWQEHPLTGVGLYNSRILLHEADYRAGTPIERLQPLNNDYLAWLAETGLVGLGAALILVTALVRAAWQTSRRQDLGVGFGLALAGIAVQAVTFHSILLLRTWLVVGAALAVYVARNERR